MKKENIKRMFHPRQIVFIGGKAVIKQGIKNCEKINYQGSIYAVNKTATEIEGVHCYKDMDELPIVPDAAFVAISGDQTIEVIRKLKNMGVSGCVCYAAGFSEVGNDQLQKRLVGAAGDMALVGPNCYGVINFLDAVPLWPDYFKGQKPDKGVAIISQSGNMSFNVTMNDRSLPLAYVLSVGNQAVLDMADYIDMMCDDPRVTAIGLHIEGLDHIEKFIQAAKRALEKEVPIIAFKTGVSEVGSQLTMSHTSSLAGSDDLYQALFKRLNITRVHSLTAFLETLKLFSVASKLAGNQLGVLTCSGGESTITADLAEAHRFTLPLLNATQTTELNTLLTKFEHVSNPLDYNTSIWGNESKLTQCFSIFMQEQFHITLLILDYLNKEETDIHDWEAAIDAYIAAYKKGSVQAIVISVLQEGMPIQFREKLIKNGIAPMQGISDAFTALTAVTAYNERKKYLHPIPENLLLSEIVFHNNNVIILDEWQGKQELHTYGLKIPSGKVISLHDELFIDQQMVGPFVVKGISKQIAHKSDIGAVKLNLQTELEIKQAVMQMQQNLATTMNGDIQFLVEEMIAGAVTELNIGIKRDGQFGLALIISMGGELVNLVNDSVAVLLPASRSEIMEALYSLKGIKLLMGFRGRPKGDVEAVINAAEAVALYAEANRNNILEMDVNPLLVLPEGQGVVAVDAFIRTLSESIPTEGNVIDITPT